MKMTGSMIPAAPRSNRSIGDILMDAGLLTSEDTDRVLLLQKQENLRFGEAAVRLGLLTEADVQSVLARQFAYPYLRSGTDQRPISEEIVAAYEPFSAAAEQVRVVRSQLMMRWYDKTDKRQVLAIVGTSSGEGRSYLAANLAVVFSQLGERTLLIDADMRTPRQHRLFKLQNKLGLSTYLAGRSRDETIIRIRELSGLFVMPAGPVPPNPLELLGRPTFDELMGHVRQSFDVVIMDTPGLASGDDAAIVAVHAGAALAVARSTQTGVAAYTDMVHGLSNWGVSVVGCVLNEVKALKTSHQ